MYHFTNLPMIVRLFTLLESYINSINLNFKQNEIIFYQGNPWRILTIRNIFISSKSF
ncbi:hypothetical protein CHRYSEO8AT_520089 [Chryseobacterium sp. 8AT]|nr:hypothetical protein CHRYSEO8AT_520089 [Chryseobacterium sp. 8AT]